MGKKATIFVRDEDSSLVLEKEWFERNGFSLELAKGYSEGLTQLGEKKFSLIISDLKDLNKLVDLFEAAHRTNFWIKTIAIVDSSLFDFLNKLFDRPFCFNIVAGGDNFDAQNLFITINKLFSPDIFGLEKYLSAKVRFLEQKITDSYEKHKYISEVREFFRSVCKNCNNRLEDIILNIADELIMNAIYDAPCDEEGNFLYAEKDRSERVILILKEEQVVQLKCAYDGRRFIVSVLDSFGSLNRINFINHLIRTSNLSHAPLQIKPGGGGTGIYLILEYINSFVINIEPRKRTEVIVIIDTSLLLSELQKANKSFNIFSVCEEFYISDMLNVTKEELEDVLILSFKGIMDENSNLGRIFDTDKSVIRINLKGIKRINSCGVREWVNAIRTIPENKKVEFIDCSPAIIKQFNMISNFGGPGKVISFLAPYFCSRCNKIWDETIEIGQHLEELVNFKAPQLKCPQCKDDLKFDDLEEKYFQFIINQESKL
ncbi:MAG: hypothetical protein NC923_02780 [Candidatus Omnitrophica bacterium]|nr:hypothetical protein [Candidatus Omnitrophota bacterium]